MDRQPLDYAYHVIDDEEFAALSLRINARHKRQRGRRHVGAVLRVLLTVALTTGAIYYLERADVLSKIAFATGPAATHER